MPSHSETKILPYHPRQLFELVADVESYPKFLPWCVGARITERAKEDGDDVVFADLVIGYKMFRERYTSKVFLFEPLDESEPYRINAGLVQGPFTHLENNWTFTPHSNGTELEFFVDFGFRSKLLEKMIGPVFHTATHKMVTAFETRAANISQPLTA